MVQKFLLGDFLLRSERGEDFFYDSTHTRQAIFLWFNAHTASEANQPTSRASWPLSLSIVIQIQMNLGRLESVKEGSGRTRTAISVFLWIWQVVPFPLSPTNYIILFFSTNHRRGKRNVLIWLYANMGGSDFHTAAETLSLQSLGRARHWWLSYQPRSVLTKMRDVKNPSPVTNHHRYSGMCTPESSVSSGESIGSPISHVTSRAPECRFGTLGTQKSVHLSVASRNPNLLDRFECHICRFDRQIHSATKLLIYLKM